MKLLQQSNAASIILKHIDLRNAKDLDKYEVTELIFNLVCATYFSIYKTDDAKRNIDLFLLYVYSNPCYFIFDWFSSDTEDILDTQIMFKGKEQTKENVEMFFNSSIDEALQLEERNFLNINNDNSNSFEIQDNSSDYKRDIINGVLLLKEKARIFSKNEIKELLVYYTFNLLENFAKNNPNDISHSLIDIVLTSINNSYEDIGGAIGYSFKEVNPITEIKDNLNNPYMHRLTNKYMSYLFQ